MSQRSDSDFLSDIQEAIKRIAEYAKNIEYGQFLEDTKTQDAVIRNLEIIGEATKGLSADFKTKHAQIEWKKLTGLRDKIIHHYFGVNWDIVWDVVQHKLPELQTQIEGLLRE